MGSINIFSGVIWATAREEMKKNTSPDKTYRSECSLGPGWMLGLFLLALAYRWLCFSVIGGDALFQNPVVDAGYHHHWAQRIVAGDILGHGPDDVFKPPLYAYFLAGWYAAFSQSIYLIQWVQYVLGALSCTMAAILAARLLGRRVGQAVGILSALYAPYVFFESQLLTPALSIFLNLSFILVLVWHRKVPSHGRMLVGGVLLGLSAGVRPDVLLPAGLIVLYILWRFRTGSWLATAGRSGCLAAGIAAVILSVAIRNTVLTGEFIPISSNAGINLYTGNSILADGVSAIPVGLRWERLVSRVPQSILEQPGQASRWWTARAWEEIAASPRTTLARLGKKAVAFFNAREFRNNICFHFMQERAWPLRLPFLQYSLILPLAVCGVVSLWQRRDPSECPALFLILVWVACFWVLGVVFFVTARFRIPAVPMMMIPAGWALVQIASAFRGGQWQALGVHAAVIISGCVLAWPMWFGHPQSEWERDYVNLGNAMRSAGDFSEADRAYRRSLAVRDDPDAHYLLARVLLSKNETADALHHLELARRALPDSPDLLLTSAQAHLAAGNPDSAGELLHHLLDLSKSSNLWPKRGEWVIAHVMLADLEPSASKEHWDRAWSIDPPTAAEASFQRRKDMPRVLEAFRVEAANKPWSWYAQANYGLVLIETGRASQALDPLGLATRLVPEKEGLRFQLARALAEAGMKNQALVVLKKLLHELPDCPLRRDVKALHARLSASGG
jgi:tetratricopeptide (TPR) repeat protein